MGRKHLVHAIASCENCDWIDDWYLTATESGRKHHQKTGHVVVVETGYSMRYEVNSTNEQLPHNKEI